MKLRFLYCFIAFFYFVDAQTDTVLYNSFSMQAIEIIDSSTAYFNLDSTNYANIYGQRWKTRSDMRALSNKIIETFENESWFNDQICKDWHVYPYIESIDTIIEDEIVSYDTTTNVGLRSFSWFENPSRAATVLMTPPITMYDNTGELSWRSMPMQGPRHQDGYKVYILKGKFNDPENTPFQALDYDFAMKELDVTNSSPLKTVTSLVELHKEFGFVPDDGTDHNKYTLPDANELGEVDSTRQQPFMQQFSLDLAEYIGDFKVAFVHDSYDNNAIFLDDILITGNGIIGSKEINPKDLKIFPNPTLDHLFIQFSDSWINPEIKIFDINGRLVVNQISFDLEPLKVGFLEPGQYFVQLKTENQIFVQSFIKLK